MKRRFSLLTILLLALTVNTTAESTGLSSKQEMEDFLQRAKVIATKKLSVGITQSKKLTLTDGRGTHAAHLQTVNVYKPVFEGQRGTELNFRDSYKYNIAAYRLDKLLKLNMVPVSVERSVGGRMGAVTWWVDNVLMMEKERISKKLIPPDVDEWNDQMYQARVFNELVYNTDANLGNLLITEAWELRMIDFTRAFRWQTKLRNANNLTRIDRRIYDGLRGLDAETLKSELGACLSKREIAGILARRDRIIEHFDKLIAEKGAAAVICEAPGH